MKKVGQVSIFLLVVTLFCGCQSVNFSPEVDELLAKVRKAKDPEGKLQEMHSQVIKGEFRTDTKNKPMQMELAFKKPKMMKIKVNIPGDVAFVKAFNGKQGWLYSTKQGLKELKGKALDEIKLQALLMAPGAKPEDIFETVKLGGESMELGEKCYKFVCQPKAEFNSQPITYFISKKSFMLIKRIEIHDTEDGDEVDIVTVFNDYQAADGIMVARHIVSNRLGDLMELNVTSVSWNEELDISGFQPPEELK